MSAERVTVRGKDEFDKVQEIVADGIEAAGLDEIVLSDEESAAKRLADAVSDEVVDRMIADARETGISLLDGPDGLIGQLTARVIERALAAEMDDHLGYGKGATWPAAGRVIPETAITGRPSRRRRARCAFPCRGTGIPPSSRGS